MKTQFRERGTMRVAINEALPFMEPDRLVRPATVKKDNTQEIRTVQKQSFGRHFAEVRIWEKKGNTWAPTRQCIRIPLNHAVLLAQEMNELLDLAAVHKSRGEEIAAELKNTVGPSIRAQLQQAFIKLMKSPIPEVI